MIGHQTLAGSQQQVDFIPSCLDQLNCPCVSDALRGLPVDLHDLISHLSGTNLKVNFGRTRNTRAWLDAISY